MYNFSRKDFLKKKEKEKKSEKNKKKKKFAYYGPPSLRIAETEAGEEEGGTAATTVAETVTVKYSNTKKKVYTKVPSLFSLSPSQQLIAHVFEEKSLLPPFLRFFPPHIPN